MPIPRKSHRPGLDAARAVGKGSEHRSGGLTGGASANGGGGSIVGQKELALRLRYSQAEISLIETGNRSAVPPLARAPPADLRRRPGSIFRAVALV
jgi:hypothetical protein